MSEEEKATRMRVYLPGRIPVTLWVDRKLNVTRVEGATITPSEASSDGRQLPQDDERLLSSDLGMRVERNEDGGMTLKSIDGKTREIMPFFSKVPCWFRGCEELRAKYEAEVEAKIDAATQEGRECRDCETGEVMRKYIRILRGTDLTR
jgi:hypothetical protein